MKNEKDDIKSEKEILIKCVSCGDNPCNKEWCPFTREEEINQGDPPKVA